LPPINQDDTPDSDDVLAETCSSDD
jgi:hypothetical protein